MKILMLSKDENLIKTMIGTLNPEENSFSIVNDIEDPLDIMSTVCSSSPSVLIADDDYLKPNTSRILHSIKKVNPNLTTVFFTSDSTIELGREILPIGIHFYSIKPISEQECKGLIQSFSKLKQRTN
ncbi:MAG: hypothetical protein K8F60_17515 [Melioribacteraceae bacterium]|nr:hypothetical protein [Melioribacteraceae bacterium]